MKPVIDEYCGQWAICCPVCGDPYVHHQSKAEIIDGQDSYKARKSVRGDVIAIPFRGECGHDFVLTIGFHKGNSYVDCEVSIGAGP